MKINRRSFFGKAGVSTIAIGISPAIVVAAKGPSPEKENAAEDEQILYIGENIAVAETKYGKVKGYIMRGINTFLGIPYGADTSGNNRFLPPQKPEPWKEIRPAVFYGNSAPQDVYDRKPESYGTFTDHWNYDEVSEDCLRLNIWTPGIKDGKTRPVLVWLHGGGFSKGNAIEQDGYHGENLSKQGDIVFVSINHRLGPFGFSDFSIAGGEKFKDSGNVGILDIIEALRWVNENIANFGGNPANVTIMGQSGGGAKVSIVSSMPAAKNLVHKGVALSGTSTKALDQKYTQELGNYILKEAGVATVEDLQNLPWKQYNDIAYQAAKKFEKEKGTSGIRRGSFGPIGDGIHIPTEEFYEQPSSPDIPMVFCTTFHEQSPSRFSPEIENITFEGVARELRPLYGDKADRIVNAYERAFPGSKPVEVLAFIRSNREAVVKAANVKLKQKSPVYMAWFGWSSPLFDGRMRSFHCLDISFWLANTDLMVTHTGGGSRPRTLAKKMSEALLNFMRKGDPNGSELPQWPKYTSQKGETLILNDECVVKNDPDREARSILAI